MSVATEVDLRATAERGAAELGPHARAEDVIAWAVRLKTLLACRSEFSMLARTSPSWTPGSVGSCGA